MLNQIICGDSLEVLKTMPDNSIDSIVTDPPYELGFMGKGWDKTGIANNVDLWRECLRVLKPGGHLLAFSGTRTYHRMTCAIEDAGFEIRDMIEWLYLSGFPKSLDVGKQFTKSLQGCQTLESNQFIESIYARELTACESLKTVNSVEKSFLKSLIETGTSTPKSDFVVELVWERRQTENKLSHAPTVGQKSHVQNLTSKGQIVIAVEHVEHCTQPSFWSVKPAIKSSDDQTAKQSMNILTARCSVKELLNELSGITHRGEEALKTSHGKDSFSNRADLNARCAVALDDLRHIIRNLAVSFLNCDTTPPMECASAITVIITKSTAEHLISSMVDTRKNELKLLAEKYQGFGGAMKPAHEPIVMARKPIEKTVAYNVEKWGTGAVNVDGCRIGDEEIVTHGGGGVTGNSLNWSQSDRVVQNTTHTGRFPANCITLDDDEWYSKYFNVSPQEVSKKASKRDRGEGNNHPTVKPTDLMAWLVRLVTPPQGVVLDPFAGSGSTLVAAKVEGFNFIGIEREQAYVEIAQKRIGQA